MVEKAEDLFSLASFFYFLTIYRFQFCDFLTVFICNSNHFSYCTVTTDCQILTFIIVSCRPDCVFLSGLS